MFSAELVIGCVWDGEKLVCDANEGFTLLSQQIHYEITFGIPSHEPGTFRCDYSPSENDVIAQPCSLTLKGEALHPVVTRVHRDRDKTDLLLKCLRLVSYGSRVGSEGSRLEASMKSQVSGCYNIND